VVISEPRVSAEASVEPKIVITAARAVLEDGRATGIVALNYSFDPIIAIIRELERRYSLSIALYDTTGEYLLWTELAGGTYFYDPANVIGFDALSRTMGMGERAGEYRKGISELQEFFFEAAVDGEPSMIEAMRVPGTRWSLIVSSPISMIRRDVYRTILPPIAVFLLAFIVAQTLVYVMYARLVINPLVGIGAHLKRLADADADLTLRVPARTNDEIGMVAVSFNAFTDKLRGLMLEVKRAIVDTDTVKMSVIASTEETSTAIEQISANLGAIGKQIDVLDSSISATVSSIEEVTGNIAAVDGRIISQASMVEESTAAITEMIASLSSVNAVAQNKQQATKALSIVAEDGKGRLTETAETFRAVSSQVLQIRDLASTINDIASQTNLLSMNAAIEAAHAGDSGKGFAVVAEEIRKLADSAGTSAKTITQTIRGIIKAVEETDKSVVATTSAFERIAAEVADTVGAFSEIERSVHELSIGGQQILESTNQINEVTADVRSGSAEIKAGTEAMLASSARIKDVSARVATGMAESITGSREIVRSMQEMVELNQRLGDIVGHLKERFGRFKTE